MNGMFYNATSFNGDISKWDVSRVQNMGDMFRHAACFNGDISKWDVSNVEDMSGMFRRARSFNADISKWDVSSGKDMNEMFYGATAFAQNLCTTAWVNSKASKDLMFTDSSGSISSTGCTATTISPAFSPQSRVELQGAVETYIESSDKRDDQMHCKPTVVDEAKYILAQHRVDEAKKKL